MNSISSRRSQISGHDRSNGWRLNPEHFFKSRAINKQNSGLKKKTYTSETITKWINVGLFLNTGFPHYSLYRYVPSFWNLCHQKLFCVLCYKLWFTGFFPFPSGNDIFLLNFWGLEAILYKILSHKRTKSKYLDVATIYSSYATIVI